MYVVLMSTKFSTKIMIFIVLGSGAFVIAGFSKFNSQYDNDNPNAWLEWVCKRVHY